MSPTLTAFTSELFYADKLRARHGLERQVLGGAGSLDGSRHWMVWVEHDGNQSSSMEEVEAVVALVGRLLRDGVDWGGEDGEPRPLLAKDFRIVAPFNAQVNRIADRLPGMQVGTVDKFQGQTCAVVIYSMATSRPEDAPRGMEFLYSLNRLNVATSRARCAVFVVASPRLIEPECRTARQMQLANALCRYGLPGRLDSAAGHGAAGLRFAPAFWRPQGSLGGLGERGHVTFRLDGPDAVDVDYVDYH
jgi:uncharacterized protein